MAAVISAIIAGVISFYVAHWQSQEAAKQAVSGQQAQAAIQLEEAATVFYQDTQALFVSRATDCTNGGHDNCMLAVPSDNTFIDDENVLDVDQRNISDPKAYALTAQLMGFAQNWLLSVGDSQREQNAYQNQVASAYSELITRCGQLIQGR